MNPLLIATAFVAGMVFLTALGMVWKSWDWECRQWAPSSIGGTIYLCHSRQ